jgi:hypothetical protein
LYEVIEDFLYNIAISKKRSKPMSTLRFCHSTESFKFSSVCPESLSGLVRPARRLRTTTEAIARGRGERGWMLASKRLEQPGWNSMSESLVVLRREASVLIQTPAKDLENLGWFSVFRT